MQKIRLAYVTHGLSANGIESLLVNIARHIDRERFDVTFILAVDPDIPPCLFEPEILSLGMRVIRICDLDGLKKKKRYISSLYSVFKKEQFDIVHANMDLLSGFVLRAAKKAGVPKRICHAHTSGSHFAASNTASWKVVLQKLYRRIMRNMIIRSSTKRIGCSDSANQYMYGSAEATVLLNGIDLQQYVQARADKDVASDLSPAAVHLATVGRISMPKNPLFLCAVVKELSVLRQDFVLHWVGTGEMLDPVKEEIRRCGIGDYIQLMGVRTDIPQILSGCGFFLLPSLFEGLGIVLIEAQACGLPCFVSDVVPRQVDAGGCRFLPLDAGAKAWAKEIDDQIRSDKVPAIDAEKMADFDIRSYVKKLENIYLQ